MKQTIKSLLFATIFLISTTVHAQISLDVGGYLQTWYIADQQTELTDGETNNTNGFRLRRARITARGDINDRISTTIWTELSGSDNILLDFYADARLHPALNVRLGHSSCRVSHTTRGVLSHQNFVSGSGRVYQPRWLKVWDMMRFAISA